MKTTYQMAPEASVFESLANVTSTTGLVLGYIGQFCFLCYNINVNPLPSLRKQYPEFEWKLIDSEHGYGDLLDQIQDVDFVWSIDSLDHVIAIHKKKSWKGVRGFWSGYGGTHDRTFADIIQDIENLGFTIFGFLKNFATKS